MSRSAIRALARVAWRDIARHRARSVLVTLLVLLPVAAMVAAISIYRTTTPSQAAEDSARMGVADLIAEGVSETKLRPHLPDGSTIERIASADGQLVLPGSMPGVQLRALNLDGLATGMLTLIDGRLPKGPAEVAITAKVALTARAGVGDQLTIEGFAPATVVGLIENPSYLGDRTVLLDPEVAVLGHDDFATWLIRLPEGADPAAVVAATTDPSTGAQEFLLQSRESARLHVVGDDGSSTFIVLGTLALVEAALVASAAFAVSIRRRQRELGLLAATGATPSQLAGTVVAEAAILGVIAALGGVVVGILGALALTPWLDDLTQRRNQPLVIDLAGLVAPAVIGLLSALIAAIAPARTAARVPVLVSLSGRRPAQAPAHRSLGIGLVAVALSIGMTLLGANLRLEGSDTVSVILMVVGAVLGTLGFGACGPWLLERLDGLAVRLPLSGRIAFRDTARARSRSSPIVTAVLASLAATVALGTWVVSRDQANAQEWQPFLYANQLRLHGASAEAAGREVLAGDGAVAGVVVGNLAAPRPGYFWVEPVDARDEKGELMNAPYGPSSRPQFSNVAVATPDVLVIANAPGAAEAIAAGNVVVLTDRRMTFDKVEFVMQDDPLAAEPSRRLPFAAVVIDVSIVTDGAIPAVLVPASLATDLQLTAMASQEFIVQFDRPVTDADVSNAAAIAAKFADTFADAAIGPPRPDEAFRLVLIALALLFALSVTGVAIALGEAESRPEQRSLLALGADPRLRRRIAAARAGVLALLAGLLAVPAGLLPVWGLLASREAPFVVPVPEIAGAVIALPLLAIACAWLLTRPLPEWAAFRGVTTGQ